MSLQILTLHFLFSVFHAALGSAQPFPGDAPRPSPAAIDFFNAASTRNFEGLARYVRDEAGHRYHATLVDDVMCVPGEPVDLGAVIMHDIHAGHLTLIGSLAYAGKTPKLFIRENVSIIGRE